MIGATGSNLIITVPWPLERIKASTPQGDPGRRSPPGRAAPQVARLKNIGERALRYLRDGFDESAFDDDVEQHGGRRDVVVPDPMMHGLKVPDPSACRRVGADVAVTPQSAFLDLEAERAKGVGLPKGVSESF